VVNEGNPSKAIDKDTLVKNRFTYDTTVRNEYLMNPKGSKYATSNF